MFHHIFNKLIVALFLTAALLGCARQQVPLKEVVASQKPSSDESKQPTTKTGLGSDKKELPIENKDLPKKTSPEKKAKETKLSSTDKHNDQSSSTKNVEKVKQKLDVSGLKSRLVGMNGTEIISLMGHPSFRRLEPPARIWQYRTMVCIVNIFLYETDRKMSAEYVESLGKHNTDVDEAECFRSILKIRAAGS